MPGKQGRKQIKTSGEIARLILDYHQSQRHQKWPCGLTLSRRIESIYPGD
jgi:hypothetical protein